VRAGDETNRTKDSINFLVSVTGAPMKAIKGLKKKPIFIFASIWIPGRGSDDSGLLRRKNALAEIVFAISLLKTAMVLGQQTNQEAETIKPKNRCKAIAFGPVTSFTINQNNDTRLGPKWHQLLVLFYGEDTHRGDGLWSTFLVEGPVLSQSDFLKSTHLFNTAFLLVITLKPNLAIGMSQSQSLQ
jgi:hypothetical protein